MNVKFYHLFHDIISDGRCDRSCIQLDVLHPINYHRKLLHAKLGARSVKRVRNSFFSTEDTIHF